MNKKTKSAIYLCLGAMFFSFGIFGVFNTIFHFSSDIPRVVLFTNTVITFFMSFVLMDMRKDRGE
jgi:hypothetical protein